MAEKRGRKRKNDLYFGPEQEEAVVNFLNEEDYILRNKIYNRYLREPLNTMIDSIIRKYKLHRKDYSFEELHSDIASYLITKADKFDAGKGKKAYSYYGTICKNYALGLIIKDTKRRNLTADFDVSLSKIHQKDEYIHELSDTNYALMDFIKNISDEIKSELLEDGVDSSKKKMNENERKVGESLVFILDNWETVFENLPGGSKYNKNTILATIREYTGLVTKDIRISMRRYKKIYGIIKGSKIENGYL